MAFSFSTLPPTSGFSFNANSNFFGSLPSAPSTTPSSFSFAPPPTFSFNLPQPSFGGPQAQGSFFSAPTGGVGPSMQNASSENKQKECYLRGLKLYETNDIEGAIKAFEEALQASTDMNTDSSSKVQIINNLGYCYMLVKNYHQAGEAFNKALKIEGGNAKILHNKIQLLNTMIEQKDNKIKSLETNILQNSGYDLENLPEKQLNDLLNEHTAILSRVQTEKLRRQSNEERQCKICLDAERNSAYLPCGHVVCCDSCAPQVKDQICPLCRKNYTQIVRIYF